MNIERLIVASVAVKGVFRRYAQLSEDEKADVIAKVKEKLKAKADGGSDADMEERVVPDGTPDTVLDTKDDKKDDSTEEPPAKPPAKQPAEEPVEEPPVESPDEPPADGMVGIVDGLVQEVEQIKSDGKVEQSEIMGLFDGMMQMVTMLVQTKAPKAPKEAMAARIANDVIAARGQQVRRKDKDQMTDNGGVSKGRDREPNKKPPRDDVKKRHRLRRKPTKEKDPDLDNVDQDTKKKSSSVHPLDRKREFLGGLVPEDNYYRSVLNDLSWIISDERGISEKAFSAQDELRNELDDFLRQADVIEVVSRFEEKERTRYCAECLYSRMEFDNE